MAVYLKYDNTFYQIAEVYRRMDSKLCFAFCGGRARIDANLSVVTLRYFLWRSLEQKDLSRICTNYNRADYHLASRWDA